MTNRNILPSWLSILLLAGLGISISPHRGLTRTSEVSRALSPVLSGYELIRMEPGEIERQIRTTGELRFRFKETDFYFNLEPHDLRTPDYRAMETGPDGLRRVLPPQPVHTFKGVLAGREDTRGRFNLTDGGVEGVVYAPGGWVYVEPLRNYLPSAPAGELVVYRESDMKSGEPLECGMSLPKRLQRGMQQVTAQVEGVTPTKYEFDIATEADYEYVQALGGAVAANLEIQGILNQVEGVYQSELLLQLQISYQNAWGTANDPYTATNNLDLLSEFTEYWNANYLQEQDYDLTHMWTARKWKDGSYGGGAAWPGTACSNRTLSYGLSTHYADSRWKYLIPAHEIGHNFGAVHPNELSPPVSTCLNTVMSGWGPGQLTFCQFSRQQIAEYVAGNNSCLDGKDITLLPPSGLKGRPGSAFGIELAWQDNSSDETGFVVQRRREGSGVWVEVGTTATNVRTFSDKGLFSNVTYIHRVQAYNEEESSAFSNEAVAKTYAAAPPDTDWVIDTVAGRRISDEDNIPAVSARLDSPGAVVFDRVGNLYIADSGNLRVRRVDTAGTITTVAGTGEHGFGGDGGPAAKALFRSVSSLAIDGDGNLYIADYWNNRIRRVDTRGIITTVAGTGQEGYSGDGGPASKARINGPLGVAVDVSGNLYIADADNHRVRRVDARGTITTVAGTGRSSYGGDGGPAARAHLSTPVGLAFDGVGNLYIADHHDHRIRRVDNRGTITTVAGTGEKGYGGDGSRAVEAQLDGPLGIAIDVAGNLYISDNYNHRIRRVDTAGTITTVAGDGRGDFGGDGGPAVKAHVSYPNDVALDGAGNLYIADRWNHRIRRVDATGTITSIAGIGSSSYGGDGGPAVEAHLHEPEDVALDEAGNLYIADSGNHRIRRVDSEGIITTVAGTGTSGYSGDGGPAVEAQLYTPRGVAVDGAGNLYIADYLNGRIRRVDSEGIITTVTDRADYPSDLVVDESGTLYIADSENDRILRVDKSGNHTVVAGTGKEGFGGDGGPAVEAQLWMPGGVGLGGAGDLYIADSANNRIRLVDNSGIITTVAGVGDGIYGGGTGPAAQGALFGPIGVASDPSGHLYIADHSNAVIRRVDGAGIMTTIAGTGFHVFSGDGGSGVEADLDHPRGIAVDNAGSVYFADFGNHLIRVLRQAPRYPTRLRAVAVSPYGIDLFWRDNSGDETGFSVQRRLEGSNDWIEIGKTSVNSRSFSDDGLKPRTTYYYRVRAFSNTASSAFSNEASATTRVLRPPTVTGFTPRQGPVGTRVTVTGAHFHGATAVRFNEVPAAGFEVLSGTGIEAVVPAEAASGPISVVTPGGTAVSTESFTVANTGIRSRLFVPIVLRLRGRTPGSFFTSEITLTNRGTTTAIINYTFTAAVGTGSGTAMDSLEPGRQRVIPDAISYLTSLGIPIGSGSAGGTLAVDFSNLSSGSAAAVTVRVTTPVEEGSGSAGLAFPGLNPEGLLTGPSFVTGLRQNRQDRSNVAVQNADVGGEESITLRATVYSGDPEAPRSQVLPDLSLPPGGFHQYNRILAEAGFDNGYVKLERVEGEAPYYAYGVINDNFNSDGSFVFPVTEVSLESRRGQTLPVIIETKDFSSELTVTNFSPTPKTVDLRFVAEAVETDDDTARFSLKLEAGEQRILPGIVDWLRQQKVDGIGVADEAFVGAVFATVAEGDMSGIVMGARTGSPDGRGGQYGLFYNGVPYGSATIESAWIYGLQQNGENRSNLALVNTGEVDDSDITLEIDIYDGAGDPEPRTRSMTLGPGRWHQLNGILAGTSQGYVEVRKTLGENPFITYGVINDGGKRGQRSGDGAFLPSQ